LEHERVAAVRIKERWVPYPFQNNIHRMPAAERDRMLTELDALAGGPPQTEPADFQQWIERSFGRTMADVFLLPYNLKVWGYPLQRLGVDWIGERVATVDLARIRKNIAEDRDDVGWGPNNRFRFPLRGGTGAIWNDVARLLPPESLRFGSVVAMIDSEQRLVRLANGEQLPFDHLITTMPLDTLCMKTRGLDSAVRTAASSLLHSSVHILGIGLHGDPPPDVQRKCWMYFPEANSPYYRVTVFSNYSPNHAPQGQGYWSLMAEVCESPSKPVEQSDLQRSVLHALRQDRLIGERTEVVSFWHRREEHGYPTPFLGRDAALTVVLGALERRAIYSRGRFGAWKYEVSNQDHSFMQGVEVVDRLIGRGDEPTLNRPQQVNSGLLKAIATQRVP
jgi:protoporphyrinogen oxidase